MICWEIDMRVAVIGFILSSASNESVLVRTSFLLVSIEQARLNLETEVEEPFGWISTRQRGRLVPPGTTS